MVDSFEWIYVLVITNKLLFLLQIATICIHRFETFPLATCFIYRVYQEESAMLRENVL